MKQKKYIGTGVACITPFKNGEVDYEGLEKVINYIIDGGVDYLVILGSTGETAMLNKTEARAILSFAIKINIGRVPIVAGNFTGNNTKDLVEQISAFDFTGIDSILSSSPAYVKPSQEGIYNHYMAIADVCPVPIILYNVPGRTNSNMEWTTTVRLAEASEKFIGIKEASGDLIQTTRILKNKPEDFFVVSDDDEVVLPMISVGDHGCISVIGAMPNEFLSLVKSALNDDYEKARELNNSIYDLHQWLYIEGNPVGVNTAMEILGLCSNEVRLPLNAISKENYVKLETCLKGIL
jgi:4-hydroxy-tetrahydrodipicolinate synthase